MPHDPGLRPEPGPVDPSDPVDPDVDLRDERQRVELHHHHPLVLAAIAVGGVIGAESRYGLSRAIPHDAGSFPWSTLLINLVGSLLLGVLMAVLGRVPRPRVARLFFGVGILGGFTTFSTYAVDLRTMLAAGHPGVAAAYLLVTLVGAVLAVTVGVVTTKRALGDRPARAAA
jgi:CrcB protein